LIDAVSLGAEFQGFTAPKLLNKPGTQNSRPEEENQEINHLTFRGRQHLFRPLKGERMNDIRDDGQKEPGEDDRDGKQDIRGDIGCSGDIDIVKPTIEPVAEKPDEGEIGDEKAQK